MKKADMRQKKIKIGTKLLSVKSKPVASKKCNRLGFVSKSTQQPLYHFIHDLLIANEETDKPLNDIEIVDLVIAEFEDCDELLYAINRQTEKNHNPVATWRSRFNRLKLVSNQRITYCSFPYNDAAERLNPRTGLPLSAGEQIAFAAKYELELGLPLSERS